MRIETRYLGYTMLVLIWYTITIIFIDVVIDWIYKTNTMLYAKSFWGVVDPLRALFWERSLEEKGMRQSSV